MTTQVHLSERARRVDRDPIVDEGELRKSAGDAIDEAIRWSTVGIVSGSDSQKWTGLGSGTLMKWSEQRLILTAAHVIAHRRAVEPDLNRFVANGAIE
jgi:hypothetical protein